MPRTNLAKSKQKKKTKAKKHLTKAKAFAEAVSQNEMITETPETIEEKVEVEEGENTKGETLGALSLRHKNEAKRLKVEIEVLNKERAKLNKRTQKEDRRNITRQIRQKEIELEERHKKELEEFAQKKTEHKEADMTVEEK